MKEKERQALFELLKLLEIYEDIDILLERLIYYVCELMNAQGGIIRLIKNGYLHITATYNISSDKTILKSDEGICGEVLKEGKVKTFNKAQLEGKQLDIPAYSAICIPLKIKEENIGTIAVYNKMQKYFSDDTTTKNLTVSEKNFGEFDEEDIAIGELFSAIASLIILKSLKFNELREREIHTMKVMAQIEELKSYLESLIQSSADAIIATDMDNIVTAWNKGAENIFGYTNEEVIEKPLPIVPDFLREMEKIYFERIKNDEILKDIETIMVTKEGKLIEVSLTMSPIKSSNGEIIGVSRIIRDITEKKRLERDLIRRNEELTKILFISSAVRSTLDLNKLLRMILTVITMGEGLGFNRAVLFLVDEENNVLKGVMAVGPSSYEEAWQIWSSMAREKKTLFEVLDELNKREFEQDSFLERLCRNISIPLSDNTPIVRAVKEGKIFNIKDVHKEEADPVIIQQLGSFAYAVIPLFSKDKAIGAVWVDNLYTRKPITEQDIHFLKGFADQVAGAIENAWIFDQIEKAEKELEMLFNSITDLIYYTDENYTIKKVNHSFLNAIGLKENEVIGKKCFKLIHRTNSPLQECPHRKAIETGRPQVGELEENYLEGVYLISSSPIFDKSNNVIGTINVAKNITELRSLKEKIISMEKMAALGEMAAKVAHEIRNPLLAIGGFAKRLDKDLKEEKSKEYIKVIIEEVKRLERILNEILSFVKPYPIGKESFKIKELVNNVINFVESTLKENNNELKLIIKEDFSVPGNYDKLKEVLLNLISNANEATKDGLITLKIEKADKLPVEIPDIQKEYLLIEVEDTGCGIQKENLKRIFDPFFTTKISGTGLGLAISKRIVEEHGGIIKVESEINKGTIFRVYLPLHKEGGENEDFGG
ncbi:PAS domain S-box protein [Thermodesulfovibrio yellowstonii]|uniref:histidine kinase n=1 Tax=Thermodesulfovibrio yellowstonii TaxID=28262 RepID=A0A9W6GFV3_9BACT|nr:PAS domain S-box protein [Thermodesulfovibrio islandicus]GLI53122.1 sensor histidine kinase [Thermodesulfovibrio islandicus]